MNVTENNPALQPETLLVMPVFNELSRENSPLLQTLNTYHGAGFNLLLVDDGSTDGSRIAAEQLGFNVITHPDGQNHGKGTAIKLGMIAALESDAEAIGFTDADGSYQPETMQELFGMVLEGQCDVAIASRLETPDSHDKLGRQLGHIGMKYLGNLAYRHGVSDPQAGAKVFSREAAAQIFHV